jgi:hypothetical protein
MATTTMSSLNLNGVGVSKGSMNPLIMEALGYMQRSIACPEEVKARIAALRLPAAEEGGGGRMNTSWRSAGGGGSRPWNPRGYQDRDPRGGGRGGGGFGNWTSRSPGGPASGGAGGPSREPREPRRPYADRALAPRFGNKARADVTTEERMLDRIRDKMNKFSSLTYEATKTWLSNLLDSGQTDFLTDFITLVFEKAAAEELHCATYAQLLTELCAGFPHLNTELQRIFDSFMAIFVDAAVEPDVGDAGYTEYLSLRERRKYRKGYAAFLGQVAKCGSLKTAQVLQTANVILDGLAAAKATEGKGSLCEEYADCLADLTKSSRDLIKGSIGSVLARITVAKEKGGSLTNKARFALMDIVELFA